MGATYSRMKYLIIFDSGNPCIMRIPLEEVECIGPSLDVDMEPVLMIRWKPCPIPRITLALNIRFE